MKFTASFVACATALCAGLSVRAGTFTYSPFTGDADSGINSKLTYTTAVDFDGVTGRTVNEVIFNDVALTGGNYALSTATTPLGNVNNNVTGSIGALVSDFFYTGDQSGNATLVLSGLTPGVSYVTTWYNIGYGNPGGRQVSITPGDTLTPFHFDENYTGGGNGNVLRYAFTATDASITFTFDADSNGDSFHHYALTNAVADNALLVTPVITAMTGNGPNFAPFTPSSTDLLQQNLLGVTSSGNFTQEGSGGVPILNNGLFSISGGNPGDNSQLATAADGSFVEFDLDTTINTLGYDISSIVTYGGWNDGGRDRQLLKISYSLVGSSDFTYLGALDFDPVGASGPSAVRAVFDTALSGVDAIRVDFFGGQENTYAGIGEVDAIGSTTVPEPGAASALLFGALCLIRRRRR